MVCTSNLFALIRDRARECTVYCESTQDGISGIKRRSRQKCFVVMEGRRNGDSS